MIAIRFDARMLLAAVVVMASMPAPVDAAYTASQDVGAERAAAAGRVRVQASDSAALQHDLALLQRLEIPFPKPVVLQEMPAGEVMKLIRDTAKVTIEIDRRAVGESGGWEVVPVSGEATTVRAALDAVLDAISPEYETYTVDVASGMLVLTDPRGQRRLKSTALYQLEPLIARVGASTSEGRSLSDIQERIADFLYETVTPEDWAATGGDLARLAWTGPVASIDAPPSIHFEVRRQLALLEATLPSANIVWAVTIAEIGAQVDDAAIASVVASRAALEKFVKDGTAGITSAPRVLTRADEPAEVTIGSDDRSITVRIEPVVGDAARVFSVRMVESSEGRTTASITLRAQPGARSAAVVERNGKRLLLDVVGTPESDLKLQKSKAP
ncbi:MAG: hypothetical protein RL136_1800 [Planctomycetota bacterium]|jgi:hypothetical protein